MRLIDADKLLEELFVIDEFVTEDDVSCEWGVSEEDIRNAPTVKAVPFDFIKERIAFYELVGNAYVNEETKEICARVVVTLERLMSDWKSERRKKTYTLPKKGDSGMKAVAIVELPDDAFDKGRWYLSNIYYTERKSLFDIFANDMWELKPLPIKKMPKQGEAFPQDMRLIDRWRGWDACIDEIVGETE